MTAYFLILCVLTYTLLEVIVLYREWTHEKCERTTSERVVCAHKVHALVSQQTTVCLAACQSEWNIQMKFIRFWSFRVWMKKSFSWISAHLDIYESNRWQLFLCQTISFDKFAECCYIGLFFCTRKQFLDIFRNI